MFTIRCEYHENRLGHTDIPSSPDYFICQTDRYEVRKLTNEECGIGQIGGNVSALMYPQRQIKLSDDSEIYVGQCARFRIAYVMNDRGKTIDTIFPG